MISPRDIDTHPRSSDLACRVESSTRPREAGKMRDWVRDFDPPRADEKRPIYISASGRDSDPVPFPYDSTAFRGHAI